MGNLFNPDNGIMKALSKLFDIVYLSILWVIFCIPVVTIGAATTALYYTTVKVIRRERGYIFREFWKSFKLNFLSATILWVITLVFGILFYFNLQVALALEGTQGKVLSVIYFMMLFLAAATVTYIYPVLSRFSIKLTKLFKTSFIMAIRHLPSTLLMIVILIIAIEASYIILPLIFILPAGGSLLFSLPMERILKKYTPKNEEEEENSGPDQWYLE